MILPCSGGRTTKIFAFYQIIKRNYQGPKIFIKSKIFRKCLRRRDSYSQKMPLRELTTEPVCPKYRELTYVIKIKSAPNSFTPNLKLMRSCIKKLTQVLLWFFIFVQSYVFMSVPLSLPCPYIINHLTSPLPIIARIQQTFCGDQHKRKNTLFYSYGPIRF